MQIDSVVKCSNWDYSNENDFMFMSQFYLHGKAETLNEYDCVEANITAFSKALRNHVFLTSILMKDGSKLDAIVIPYFKCRPTGLICLCDDYENIKHALFEYDNHCYKDTCIEESEKQYLYEKYPEFQNIIREYNYKH